MEENGDAWVDDWVTLLDEVGRLRQIRRDALALIEDLLADPFIAFDTHWGSRVRRLSEWEEVWRWTEALYQAIDPAARPAPPWAAIRQRVERERAAQALSLPPGGIDL